MIKEFTERSIWSKELSLRALIKTLLKVVSLLVFRNTQVMASHQTSITQTDSPCGPYKYRVVRLSGSKEIGE